MAITNTVTSNYDKSSFYSAIMSSKHLDLVFLRILLICFDFIRVVYVWAVKLLINKISLASSIHTSSIMITFIQFQPFHVYIWAEQV